MKQVSVTELKNRLSHYLRMVRRGVEIEVVERSQPIARISGATPSSKSLDARIERLIRDGILTPPKIKPNAALFDFPPIPCSGDVVRAVFASRGDR